MNRPADDASTLRRRSARRGLLSAPWLAAAVAVGVGAAWAAAQPGGSPPPAGGEAVAGGDVTLWSLFKESFDLFTVLLVAGSLVAWTVIIMTFIDVRESNILPPESEQMIRQLGAAGQWGQMRQFVAEDDAFVSRVMEASIARAAAGGDRDAAREAAELAASEECARWFRKIEPLNVIGNLGPLLGLAGTVWGMVIAFAALGQAGGQASPANLSLGISKALFHTLLGLLLAVPALTVFGFYRTRIDRLCNRAMQVSSELVDLLPLGGAGEFRAVDARAAMPPAARPAPMPVGAGGPARPGATGR